MAIKRWFPTRNEAIADKHEKDCDGGFTVTVY